MKFPISFQHLPSSSSLHPTSFALSSTLVTDVTDPKAGNHNKRMLGLSEASFFFVVMDQSKDAHNKRKKIEILWSPKEISMSHKRLPSLYFYIKFTSIVQGKITTYNFRQKYFLQQTRRLNIRRERGGFFGFVFPPICSQ